MAVKIDYQLVEVVFVDNIIYIGAHPRSVTGGASCPRGASCPLHLNLPGRHCELPFDHCQCLPRLIGMVYTCNPEITVVVRDLF